VTLDPIKSMNQANPIYSQAAREVQTVRCCGRIYKRWRFKGKRNFTRPNAAAAASHRGARSLRASHCAVCGERLVWPANFEPQWIAAVRRLERRIEYYNQRVDWLLAGFNTRARRFGRTPNFLTVESRLAARRARGLKAWRKRVARLKALGLTTRGTRPVRRRPATVLARQWRLERLAMPTVPAAWWEDIGGAQERATGQG
jgi:hypothetical protein